MSNIRKLPLDSINILAGTQSRAELNQATVEEYADALQQGTEFPPVVVFSDGAADGNWLADGFHRYHGHRTAGLAEITCDVRVGTLRDAKLFAAGANGTHGLRRTNADKRQAVAMVLSDVEWQAKPETWLADACKVSRTLVRSMLEELHLVQKHDAVRTVERNGKTYEMNTAQIGKPSAPTPAPTSVATPPAPSRSAVHTATPVATPDAAPAPTPNIVQQVQDQKNTAADSGAKESPAAIKMIEVDEEVYLELIRNFEQTLEDYAEMSRLIDADDRLQAAMGEIARYKSAAASAKQSLDSKMGENNELIRTVKSLRAQLDREKRRADDAEHQLNQMRSAA